MTFRSDASGALNAMLTTAKDAVYFVVGATLLLALIAVVLAWPLIVVWCLNALFPVLAIEYSITSWIAVFVLVMLIKIDWVR